MSVSLDTRCAAGVHSRTTIWSRKSPNLRLQVCRNMIDLGVVPKHLRTQEETVRYERTSAISERHSTLLQLVREGDHSTKSLADHLEVSQPTINRDIEFLREQGYEIKAVRVQRRWAYQIACDSVRENGAIAPLKRSKR